uniref:SIR2 family protein n=1 Tax=Listeria costaricensis TaxID=2026604 RepID=UPI0019695971
MGEYYTEKEFETLVNALADAVKDFNLVVFIGAGISLSQGYPNWDGYIEKLVHFWQFNIRNFPEVEGKISNKLLSQFDEILKSKNTNKRKIDLLYTLLYGVLGEKLTEVKLDFEKYYFNSVLPDSIENSIVVELIKLDPIFITSNYDFEIEKHLGRSKQKGAFKPINNVREFTNLNSVLRSGDVLHLHGTTKGDWDFFVNSSLDYSRQYLKTSEDLNNLRDWFQEKNPVVLFIGSSMEEDEILSLLPATTKNFALMKANSNETQEFRELYNQTFQINNSTNIFWYGDSYNDLPKKVNEIVSAIQKELEIPESIEDWNILHAVSTNDEMVKGILEKHLEDERFLFDIFKVDDIDLEEKILKNTFRSPVLLKKASSISSFWVMLDKNFETLDKAEIQSILVIFQKQKLNIYFEGIF